MKHYLIIVVMLFCFFNTTAQVKSIELPDVDVKVGVLTFPHFDFYVTKENVIIYNNDTIKIHQIKEFLHQPIKDYGMEFTAYMYKYIHILADKNVKYKLIDSIKTEISSTNSSKYIIYRSNFEQEKTSNIKGIKHKSPMSFYSFLPPEFLKTDEEIRIQDSISKEEYKLNPDLLPVPSFDDPSWIPVKSIERATYSIQQKIIDEVLNNKTFNCYYVTNEGLKIGSKQINLDKNNLERILLINDVVFIKYTDDLIYSNYIKFAELLQELKPNFTITNANYAEVIELSYQIQELHKKAKIKLCD
jgi:biopolymer transport protein ExbD